MKRTNKRNKMSLLEAVTGGDDYFKKVGKKINDDDENDPHKTKPEGRPGMGMGDMRQKMKQHHGEMHGDDQDTQVGGTPSEMVNQEQGKEEGRSDLPAEGTMARLYGTETLGMLANQLRSVDAADHRSQQTIENIAQELDKMQQIVSKHMEG